MMHWNTIFWVVFIALGAIIIAGSMAHILYLDIIFGLLVVGVGAAKLGEEITDRHLQSSHSAMNQSISYLTRQVDDASSMTEHIKDSSDSRFFRTDRKFRDIEEKMESDYNSLAKKMVSLENRMNEHSRLMLEIAKRQEALRARQEPAPAPQVFVPRTSVVPEKSIMRFSLPKIAPKAVLAKPQSSDTKKRPKTRKAAGKTTINISAPPKTQPQAKALKRKATKKVAKNISINIT